MSQNVAGSVKGIVVAMRTGKKGDDNVGIRFPGLVKGQLGHVTPDFEGTGQLVPDQVGIDVAGPVFDAACDKSSGDQWSSFMVRE